MSQIFVFRFLEPKEQIKKSLAIFSEFKFGPDTIVKILKQDVTENLVPKNVYLITTSSDLYKPDEYINNIDFAAEFDSYVGDITTKLFFLSSDSSGNLNASDGGTISADLSKAILQNGMLSLFRKHSGLIVSNTAYHFVKPSGAHCNKFIRASNLLVSSSEVAFLAISLLPCLRPNIKRIYVDTSSIAFLISIAIRLYGGFECITPAIESFESYAALSQRYDFVEGDSSLVFISATTSGSLARDLLEMTNLSNSQIHTLFYINLPNEQNGIFDISGAIEGSLTSMKSADCELCKRGSKPIRIAGDQFLPENPKHELRVIRKSDFTRKREDFFRQFASMEVLKWGQSISPAENSKEHFYIDVKQAIDINDPTFNAALKKAAKRYISQDLKKVITLDDTGSQALCSAIKAFINENLAQVEYLKDSQVDESSLINSGSVMVIAGAITSGRNLRSISRKLRCISQDSSIVYLVGFSKLPNSEAKSQLEKDLTQGGHSLVVLNECALPRIKEYTKTAWDWESELLMPFGTEDPLGESHTSLPNILENRRLELNNQNLDYLFLPSIQGGSASPLKLRNTFAFWSDLGFDSSRLQKVTQADVYWTIQCVLHDLRNKGENNGLATAYHTTLISPVNFDRYNDGVIQACLLRAAYPIELDYRVDSIFSRQMSDVITSVIRSWDNAQGEAALEFLMALWSGRLQLLDEHLREIINCKSESMSLELKFILDQIDRELSSRT